MRKAYLTSLGAALAVTAVIGLMPHSGIGPERGRGEVAVFHPSEMKRLTSRNLVDAIVSLQLTGRVGKVQWTQAVLTVEMRADDEKQTDRWYKDMEKLIRLSFTQTENVNRLLIRYVDAKAGGQLLFAADVRRTDNWLGENFNEISDADPLHDELWRKRLRIAYTSLLEDRLGPIDTYSTSPLPSS
ncbi:MULTISPECIES: hypothetical protein [unclassified Paenibacillus]|uniref:hypothetical protein n=1 Tax=unclassified Paenibacillus TaxID=185978 RepID=UPI00104CB324|nr:MULTISPECIES: hypothetical protein [unclassified Paenibacillus]NIK67712.1 hypothetical protein [Paenibacillus sp. BK720]TCN01753.1 hypothetical protein EV294_1011213 [Paenibacillus sp. BK033]